MHPNDAQDKVNKIKVLSQIGPKQKDKMNRREFLQKGAQLGLAASPAASLLTSCSGDKSFSTDPDLPNILFITADNLGIGDLSLYGNETVKTPNIDRIGKEGVKFENAFVVSSSCAPSRASFITGQYPHTHGVNALPHMLKHWNKFLNPFATTLPDLFQKKGYNTAIEGKWHVSPFMPTSWYGYNERLSGIFADDHVIKDSKTSIEFLKKNKNNRFFFQINYKNSHRDRYGEYEMNPESPIDPEKIKIPEYMDLPDWPEIRKDVARYFSQNMKMEKMIGEVLDALDELGLSDNTMVLFLSDNGPHYPGMISTLYDRGIATPMMVRWPKKIPAGKVVSHLINSIDIMPTFLEAAGIPIPDSVQGKSFWPMLVQENAKPTHEVIYAELTEHVEYIPCRAVRTKEWKYIKNYSDNAFGLDMNNHDDWAHRLCELPGQPWKDPRPKEELYNLKKDPYEKNNLADDKEHQDQLGKMRQMLKDFQKRTNDPFIDKKFTHDYNKEDYKPVEPGHKYF